jgi:DNA-binding MarR family transcriptional regulator
MPKAPTTTTPRECAVRLRASVSQLTRRLRAVLPVNNVSVAKLTVLGHLHRLGALTPSELARRERVKLQTLTRLLAELEADRWISRDAHAVDKRQSVLSLTTLGKRALANDVHRREASLVEAISAVLSPAEQAQLLRACSLLDRVAQAVGLDPSIDEDAIGGAA